MEKREKPSFYGILPASVRYDKRVKPMARILFADITALANAKGYCNASNKTLGEWHEVAPETASRWVSNLKKTGHIEIVEIKEGKNIIERRIYPISNAAPIDKKINRVLTKTSRVYCQKDQDPIDKNVKENNTSKNITSINISKCVNTQKTPPQEPDEIEINENPIITVTNENKSDKENLRRDSLKTKRSKFVPPKAEEVYEVMVEYEPKKIKNIHLYPDFKEVFDFGMLANKFHNHYTANEWKVGRNKMKDYTATARNWVLSEFGKWIKDRKPNASYDNANNTEERYGAAKVSDIKQALFELDQEKRAGVFF